MLKFNELMKIGEKPGGTVSGAMYKSSDGRTWMVKFVETDMHARNEVLAARLYEAAGVRVPNIVLVAHEEAGRLYVASEWMDKLYYPRRLDGKLKGLLENFFVDAWLANWDVVGLEYDNILVDGAGEAIRIDLGGSLFFRAQGAAKGDAFTKDDVKEIVTMLHPKVNRQSSNVFGRHMELKHFLVGGLTMEAIEDSAINNAVNEAFYGEEPALRTAVFELLRGRRDFLVQGFEKLVDWKHC